MPRWNPIVTILPGGPELRFGRRSLTISEARTGRTYQYEPALESITLPARAPGQSRSSIRIPTQYLNVPDLRDAGILLGGASAEVAMWREGDDFKDREILLTGRVEPNGVRRQDGYVTLQLSDYAQQLNRRFPPHIITVEGFPNVNANQAGKVMNVLYGAPVKGIPVQLVDPYNDSENPGTYEDDLRFIIAGHQLTQREVLVTGFKTDSFTRPVLYGFDHVSGARYAYFTLTQLQLQGANSVVCEAYGHVRNGFVINGLGDVIEHALLTYSGLPEDRIDYGRLTDFIPRANQLAVSSIFGGDGGGTLLGLLSQRYREPLGVRLDWQNGKFGADLLSFDQSADEGPALRIGHELIERLGDIEYTTEDDSEPYSSFEISYDPNLLDLDAVGNPALRLTSSISYLDDERCSENYTRFGHVPFPLMETPDVNVEGSARVILNWAVDRFAVQRTRVRYLAHLDEIIHLPILRPYSVTDPGPQAGWTDEKMRLEKVELREDDTAVMTFRSFKPSI